MMPNNQYTGLYNTKLANYRYFAKLLRPSTANSFGFLGHENDSLAVEIKAGDYLEAEILAKNLFYGSHFVKSKMAAIWESGQWETWLS